MTTLLECPNCGQSYRTVATKPGEAISMAEHGCEVCGHGTLEIAGEGPALSIVRHGDAETGDRA